MIIIQPHMEAAHAIAADQALAKEIAAHLGRHYPGHKWAVNVNGAAGVATIENWALSTREGYTIRLNDLQTHDDVKRRAVLFGGEFLERFGVARGRANDDEVRDLSRTAWKR